MEITEATRGNENMPNLQERLVNLDRQMDLLLKEAEILRSILSLNKGDTVTDQAELHTQPTCPRDAVTSE
jgi:hypothetical protein